MNLCKQTIHKMNSGQGLPKYYSQKQDMLFILMDIDFYHGQITDVERLQYLMSNNNANYYYPFHRNVPLIHFILFMYCLTQNNCRTTRFLTVQCEALLFRLQFSSESNIKHNKTN